MKTIEVDEPTGDDYDDKIEYYGPHRELRCPACDRYLAMVPPCAAATKQTYLFECECDTDTEVVVR